MRGARNALAASAILAVAVEVVKVHAAPTSLAALPRHFAVQYRTRRFANKTGRVS